jgi:hypothetical protein
MNDRQQGKRKPTRKKKEKKRKKKLIRYDISPS